MRAPRQDHRSPAFEFRLYSRSERNARGIHYYDTPARRRAVAALRAYQAGGKLPAMPTGFTWPKRMKLERLPVLPPMPLKLDLRFLGRDDRTETDFRAAYLEAMGWKDERQANPSAIYWRAFEAMEAGERCDACGRRGETLCLPCREWAESVAPERRTGRAA